MHGASQIPREIVVPTKHGSSPSEFVGPSLWGYVYKSKEGHHYHRLIPFDDVPTFAQRVAIADSSNGPQRPLIARISDTNDVRIGSDLYYSVTYEVFNESSLSEVLKGPDPRTRLWCVAKVLEALPSWWSGNGEGLPLLPADVVFNGQWPYLLALPPMGLWPRFSTLISEPLRVSYLAPEILRNHRLLVEQRAIDVYACGAMALQSLYSTDTTVSPETLLRQAATATLYERDRLVRRVPPWMDGVDHLQSARKALLMAVDPDPRVRRGTDPIDLARHLLTLIEYLDPLKVAQEYRDRGQIDQVLSFASTVNQTESNDDVTIMAARIAAADLGRSVFAVEQYERVLTRSPSRTEASREQLLLLLHQDWSQESADDGDAFALAENVDLMAWRDYWMLSEPETREFIVEAAEFFMKRGKNAGARQMLRAHIWQGEAFHWWEIQLCLLYTEALVGEGEIAEAATFLDSVKMSLNHISGFQPGDPRCLVPENLASYGSRIAQLDEQIRARQR